MLDEICARQLQNMYKTLERKTDTGFEMAICSAPSLNFLLRARPGIHERNALREVLLQWVSKFPLKSIITL